MSEDVRMFAEYAKIEIQIKASQEEINGPNELELSDAVFYLQENLDKWLKETYGHKFRFTTDLK